MAVDTVSSTNSAKAESESSDEKTTTVLPSSSPESQHEEVPAPGTISGPHSIDAILGIKAASERNIGGGIVNGSALSSGQLHFLHSLHHHHHHNNPNFPNHHHHHHYLNFLANNNNHVDKPFGGGGGGGKSLSEEGAFPAEEGYQGGEFNPADVKLSPGNMSVGTGFEFQRGGGGGGRGRGGGSSDTSEESRRGVKRSRIKDLHSSDLSAGMQPHLLKCTL